MEFQQYIAACTIALKANPQWRLGQGHFNVLSMMRPDLTEPLRGGELDPFYRDELLPAFLEDVEKRWGIHEEEGHASA